MHSPIQRPNELLLAQHGVELILHFTGWIAFSSLSRERGLAMNAALQLVQKRGIVAVQPMKKNGALQWLP